MKRSSFDRINNPLDWVVDSHQSENHQERNADEQERKRPGNADQDSDQDVEQESLQGHAFYFTVLHEQPHDERYEKRGKECTRMRYGFYTVMIHRKFLLVIGDEPSVNPLYFTREGNKNQQKRDFGIRL
jgi:hypothetical protein